MARDLKVSSEGALVTIGRGYQHSGVNLVRMADVFFIHIHRINHIVHTYV